MGRESEKRAGEQAGLSGASASGRGLLEEAANHLQQLEKKIQAARYEAQHAELEQLIRRATVNGDYEGLAQWLGRLGGLGEGGALNTSSSNLVSRDPASDDPASGLVTHIGSSGWGGILGEQIAASAKRRNDGRLLVAEEAAGVKAKLVAREPPATMPCSGVEANVADETKASNRATPGAVPGSVRERGANPRRLRDVHGAFDRIALQQADEGEPKKGRRKVAGAAVSAVAHVVLLGGLALVTLKLPGDAASLGFQSSVCDSKEPVVEINEQIDVEAPTGEVSEPAASTFDASESLAGMEPLLTDCLQELSTRSNVLSASAALANAASASGAAASMSTAASFFGAAAGGNNFCYVLDVSASMRGGPWESAKSELLRSLASLKPKQRYFIICFSRTLNVMPDPDTEKDADSALYATPENLQHTRRWIETMRINAAGGPARTALKLAVSKDPDAIYLLTDGVTKVDVAEFLEGINRYTDLFGETQVQVPVHAIGYYSREGEELMRRIAAQNRGQFIYVPDPRGG